MGDYDLQSFDPIGETDVPSTVGGTTILTATQAANTRNIEVRNTGAVNITICDAQQTPVYGEGWEPVKPNGVMKFSLLHRDLPANGLKAIAESGTGKIKIARG